jgi:hypothetical protein
MKHANVWIEKRVMPRTNFRTSTVVALQSERNLAQSNHPHQAVSKCTTQFLVQSPQNQIDLIEIRCVIYFSDEIRGCAEVKTDIIQK